MRSAGPRVGIVTFPGSLDDADAARAVRLAGATPLPLWHAEHTLHEVDAVVLPGGFSYGDHLRAGALARFSPVMRELVDAARAGLPVLGICNGFQVLCEAGLLPGALTRNAGLHFVGRDLLLRLESTTTAWTGSYASGQRLLLPVKNGEGCYVADAATLDRLEGEGRVVVRYVADEAGGARGRGNPNGSRRDIAGISDARGRVVGLMPHPEHAVEELTGPSTDGLGFFTSVVAALAGLVAV